MANIYITNFNADYDYADAERYLDDDAQMIYMTAGFVKVKDNEAKIAQTFNKFFAHAKAEDMILLSGHALLGVLALNEWNKYFDGANVLYLISEKRNGKVVHFYHGLMLPASTPDETQE